MRTALTLTRQTALTLTRQHVRCSHSYQTHAHCSHSYQTDSTRSLSPNRQLSLLPDSTCTALTLTRQHAHCSHSYQRQHALTLTRQHAHCSHFYQTDSSHSYQTHAHSSHSYQTDSTRTALTLIRDSTRSLLPDSTRKSYTQRQHPSWFVTYTLNQHTSTRTSCF